MTEEQKQRLKSFINTLSIDYSNDEISDFVCLVHDNREEAYTVMTTYLLED